MTEGARNFFFIVQSATKFLSPEEKRATATVFKNNCYFAHPESILLSALEDKQLSIRKKAVQKIVDARKKPKGENVRHFSLPKSINLAASDYFSLIDMSKEEITEAPLTMDMTDEQLMDT